MGWNKKHGDFIINGAKYTVNENTRWSISIQTIFHIHQETRDCSIDIAAYFQQWKKLDMKLGKII